VAIQVEQEDILEVKSDLPNICVVGGMSTQFLGGGFMLSQDKMMSYPRDCKPENLKAVSDFVQEYRLQGGFVMQDIVMDMLITDEAAFEELKKLVDFVEDDQAKAGFINSVAQKLLDLYGL
jgi:hypothetical protein